MTKLTQLNPLVMGENGVWTLESTKDTFDYSDGAETEHYLREIFDKTSDLSAQSAALEQAIYDWPSEYHLSPKRGNLFRPFDLSVFNSVLDIGSGCGSIARYLGEHIQHVDAVEGAPIRADLARRRCKDLNNVHIINANFNHLKLKGADYQLATLIGVAEYAGKFYPDAQTDFDAVTGLLNNVADALDDNGVVMIAIENRLGAKYMLGQPEDHYHSPYEGINRYPRKHGMCTYDREEWNTILANTPFAHSEFYGAFYDYKLPTLLIGEDYARNPQVVNHLIPFPIEVEVGAWCKDSADKLWDTMAQLQRVMEMANSFFIIASKSKEGLNRLDRLDFAHTPSFSRKIEFSTVIKKLANENTVRRTPIQPNAQWAHAHWQFHPKDEPYFNGTSLLKNWLDIFMLRGSLTESQQLITDYYQLLKNLEELGTLEIDVLPQNILVEGDELHIYDQEWGLNEGVLNAPLADYVLFRALLFLAPYTRFLGDFYSIWNCRTHWDFIREVLKYCGVNTEAYLESFADLETEFQQLTHGKSVGLEQLKTPIADSRSFSEAPWLWASVSLENTNQDRASWTKSYQLNADRTTLEFAITNPLVIDGDGVLTFSPCDFRRPLGVGLFAIDTIAVGFADGSSRSVPIEPVQINDLVVSEMTQRFVYAIDGVAPMLSWTISGLHKANAITSIAIAFTMRSSVEYWQIEQDLLTERDQLKVEIEYLRRFVTKPYLPERLVTEPVPRELPETLKPLKDRVLQKITRQKPDGSFVPPKTLPMDWRFMPPMVRSVASSTTQSRVQIFDNLSVVVQSDLSASSSRALKQLAKNSQVVGIDGTSIGEALAQCDHGWVLFIDPRHELLTFTLDDSVLNNDKATIYYGDELCEYEGWAGVRREPQSIKHAALSGYCGVGVTLVNPNAKTRLLSSSHQLQQDTLAHGVMIAAISNLIPVRHCNSVVSQYHYTKFVWPPHINIVSGYDEARAQFVDNRPNVRFIPSLHIDGFAALQFQNETEPKVSIIIPFKDNPAILENCVLQLIENTWYRNYEIVGVNNASVMRRTFDVMDDLKKRHSQVRFIDVNEDFNFSLINNRAAGACDGEYLVFLNNDVLIDTPDWIHFLLAPFYVDGQCGVSGGCLNYPEGIIQSCGIAIGEDGLPVNVGNNMLMSDEALFGRFFAARDVLAVSAAMMMTPRALFLSLGGFNETDFTVAFNDVDYCLRAVNEGKDVVAMPNVKARHFESYSRLSDFAYGDKYQRFRQEQAAFKRIHSQYATKPDPFHPEIGLKA